MSKDKLHIRKPPETIWVSGEHVPYKEHIAYEMYIQYEIANQLKRLADILEEAISDD